ncbi:GNAT family N-acetyltransferase [Psychroserpens sp.]|uniref:GNAT family N-acetyltransferase n=1 Tax=Psychroserpens sp. TaxID=2020870 RepID=UPI001B161095|nr:GNAT family N-acetyltransferase [Psychroserpens sp.]MBO6606832.1 GNAT family N-acetyltransferase [Psychroserpens sp.]MBO6631233.1 GNAT family N-acetyltransferase [Psychroserpens sp.]MBO6653535.1 GNAT family N-acetyltransferase [Psychroserpens sp.]MBO6680437.1 GNAT family N-acetyltransferase [Psychroserpens sp.]MBO6750604.1 GNAT family N-acetyltransferase [Psychroserpens sp.]
MIISRAKLKDLNALAELFDGYRVFYKQESNISAGKRFLKQRMMRNDSIIYIAYENEEAVGFTQLYPLFSSVSIESMYILNDLYVSPKHRNKGIGEALLDRAKHLCRSENNKGLALQTARDNPAQHLYTRLGFVKDTDLLFFWKNS